MGETPGGGSVEEVDLYEEFQESVLRLIDPDAVKAMKVVVDAGPDRPTLLPTTT